MKRVLDLLGIVAKRPGMYIGPLTYLSMQSYLLGLQMGCELAGIEYSPEQYQAAARSLGWDPTGNIGIRRDFERKGLSDEEMARALIAVEIEAYRRAMEDDKGRSKGTKRKAQR